MEQYNVIQLFNLGYFEIPRYQRAYSWGKKQREQLIEDIRDAKGKYYLGHPVAKDVPVVIRCVGFTIRLTLL